MNTHIIILFILSLARYMPDLYVFGKHVKLPRAIKICLLQFYSIKSGRLIPPALFFFLKIALAIWDLLSFHTNFKIFCSSSVKNAIGVLIEIALNLQIALGGIVTFIILILLIREHVVALHCVILDCFHQCHSCLHTGLLSPQVGLFLVLYSFCCNVEWDSFLNFFSQYFIVGIQECQRVLHIDFVFCSFTKFID